MITDVNPYGRYYYCVKVPKTLSQDGEIYVYGNKVLLKDGCLIIEGAFELEEEPRRTTENIVFAPGSWLLLYAASCLDGSPIAVEYWKGKIQRS